MSGSRPVNRMWRLAGAIVLGCTLLAACSKPDPSIAFGRWRAEPFALDSLKLPISPNLEVTPTDLILQAPDGQPLQRLPLAGIRAERDLIELELRDAMGVSLEFKVESRDRLRFRVPLVGFDVIYNRV